LSDDADLYGTAEIAALLGVSRQRVLAMLKKGQLPKPLTVLSSGNIWRGSDIREWAASRQAPS
jgi:prophage regulatory protein